ncbi:tetratricopeptide repeat protein, partial [Myxococcota bacterium]|nr:tetratricopeptide repeat protein [Myxococcota bacterium]MBU1511896.1 tetratricopeptide repeat protein [Myxococcota bacterium]
MTHHTLSALLLLSGFLLAWPAEAAKLHCPKPSADRDQDHQIALRYHKMGRVYLRAGDSEKALRAFDCVLTLTEKIPMARLDLARAYDALKLYSTARLHYRRALEDAAVEGEHAGIRKRLAALDGLTDRPSHTTDVTNPFASEPGGAPVAGGTEEDDPEPDAPQPIFDAEMRRTIATLKVLEQQRLREACGTPVPAPRIIERWWFWTGAGAAAVLSGVALYGAVRWRSLADEWDHSRDDDVHDELRG